MGQVLIFVGVVLAAVLSAGRAEAYLDPGTGSYVVQVIIAALVGSGFALKLFWKRIVHFFRRAVLRKDDHDADRGS